MSNKTKIDWLYEFSAKDGEQERSFAILKCGRKIRDKADEFYASIYTRFLKAGVMPRAVFQASIENLGKTISDAKQQERTDTLNKFSQKLIDLEKLKRVENLNENQSLEISELEKETKLLKDKLIDFEIADYLVYQNTAEYKAQFKTITWLLLHLAHEKINGVYTPIFPGNGNFLSQDDLEARLDQYEELEGDEFMAEILRRINYLITLWFLNRIEDPKDFAEFDKENQTQLPSNNIEKEQTFDTKIV